MTRDPFRNHIPQGGHPRLGDVDFSKHDVDSWVEFGLEKVFIRELWGGWQQLYREPYRGLTAQGPATSWDKDGNTTHEYMFEEGRMAAKAPATESSE